MLKPTFAIIFREMEQKFLTNDHPMVRTVFFFTIMWFSLLVSLLIFIPYLFLLLPVMNRFQKVYIYFWTSLWARMILRLSGSKIKVQGKENIPVSPSFAIISNHQGYMDIPVLMSIFPYPLSFVAKKELLKVPIINFWLLALDCIMIDRLKPHSSYRKIAFRIRKKDGNPVILFPEGTRSKGAEAGKWKMGGLKLVEESGISKILVTIDGSYKIWEENRRIRATEVKVSISK